jgi:hypothetical protein
MGDGRIFFLNHCASLLNDDLSNEPNFRQIHLAVKFLRKYVHYGPTGNVPASQISTRFCLRKKVLTLLFCLSKELTSPFPNKNQHKRPQ